MPDDQSALQASLQMEWLQLIRIQLPQAAASHPDWPVRLDHCFARIILDAICGQPWRKAIKAPAYKHMTAVQLRQAIALTKKILQGDADLQALNR